MRQKKWYVVWKGRRPAVYSTWLEARVQVDYYPEAKYKSFASQREAESAFRRPWYYYYGKSNPSYIKTTKVPHPTIETLEYPKEFIAVDGAWNSRTLDCEFRGVLMPSREEYFSSGPHSDGTNNIVEFLALTTAIQKCQSDCISLPIYSDSTVAIGWVRKKATNSLCKETQRNADLLQAMRQAVEWLNENQYENKVLHWQTKQWGQIPADYGRK